MARKGQKSNGDSSSIFKWSKSVPFWNLKKLRNLLLEEKPIIPLKTIFKELESKPPIPSGTILEKEIDEPIILDDAA